MNNKTHNSLKLIFVISIVNLLLNSICNAQLETNIEHQPPLWPWKGINIKCGIESGIDELDIQLIKENHMNMIHILLDPPKNEKWNHLNENEVFNILMDKTEQLLVLCKKYDLTAIVSFHKFPWISYKKFNQTSKQFWNDSTQIESALNFFEKGVKRLSKYGDELSAYEFISEPIIRDDGKIKAPKNIYQVQKACIDIIEKIDNGRFFCASSSPGGHPKGFKIFLPFENNFIIYNFHYFAPHEYTHQGIKNLVRIKYPGFVNFRYWDSNRILAVMKPALEWKSKYNKLMMIGSFGVVYWAEGRNEYLNDLLNHAIENKLSYSYHCYNGFTGWSLLEVKNNNNNIKTINSLDNTYQTKSKKDVINSTWQIISQNQFGTSK